MKNFMGRTMAKMNDNRKKGRKALKGFTLVEIIVVLVILAILAAAMIPALTGYIDKAKEKTVVTEARSAVTAAQTLASEAYGLGKTIQTASDQTSADYTKGYGWTDIIDLADVKGRIDSIKIEKGKVVGLIYIAEDSTYDAKNGTDSNAKDNRYIKYTRDGGFEELVDMSEKDAAKPTLS